MSSYGSDDFNFSALNDYLPWGSPVRTSTPIPPAAGVGLSLNTPSPQSSLATPPLQGASVIGVGTAGAGTPSVNVTAGVGSAGSGSSCSNVTAGVGRAASGTPNSLRRMAGRSPTVTDGTPLARATRGGKRPRRVPRQNTPTSPSDAGSRRRSSASDSGGRRRGRGRGGGGGGGGGSGSDSTSPSSVRSGLSRSGRRRRGTRVLDQAQMQQQLEEILRQQQQTAAGRHIAGITTSNTITTTCKNGQRSTVTFQFDQCA